MTTRFDALRGRLEKELSGPRFRHSLAVAQVAADLAARHGWNPEKARLAGLLHDCAKEWAPKKLLAHVRRHRVPVPNMDFILKISPNLLHAYVGADRARRAGWTHDAEVLNAMRAHTVGRVPMAVPDKILYVADFAAHDRTFPEAGLVRASAEENLEVGFRAALEHKIRFQLIKGHAVHPLALRLWNRTVARI